MSFDETVLENDQEIETNIATSVKLDHTQDLNVLQIGAEAISLEFMATPEGFKTAIQNISTQLSNISGFIRNKFSRDHLPQNIFKNDQIKRAGSEKNYLVYSKMRVYKSVGQVCKTVDLVRVMSSIFSSTILPFIKEDLPRIEVMLANLATNKDELRSVRHGDIISKTFYSTYESNLKALSVCFNAKDGGASAQFGDLFERYADYETSCNDINEISDSLYKLNIDKVIHYTDKMDSSVQIIIQNINNGYEISPIVIKALADSTYQLAMLLEFYSIYLYKLREINVSLRDTGKVIR